MYFTHFPKIQYDIDNSKNFKLVTDILRRVKIRNAIRDNISLFDKYDVVSGDTPESVSYKVYNTTEYYYTILLVNNITDRYYGWPLSDQAFEEYVKQKYTDPSATHHYEIVQSSGATTGNGPEDYDHFIEVNSTEPGAQSVSNYEYERRLQDQKRQIRLLKPVYLSNFVREFKSKILK